MTGQRFTADWEPLLGGMFDGTLTVEDRGRLDQLMQTNPQARREYLDLVDVHTVLRRQLGDFSEWRPEEFGDAADEVELGAASWLQAVRDVASNYMALSALVSALVIANLLLVMALIVPDWERAAPVAEAPDVKVVATITATHQATWDKASDANFKNIELFAGERLVLNSGLAEVTFADGAMVVLEGPTEFRIGGRAEGRLDVGSLSARVPEAAGGGLIIDTPQARIKDIGTEFGIDVAPDGAADVVVLSGIVDVIPQQTGATASGRVRITAGEGVSIAADGTISRQEQGDPRRIATSHARIDADFKPTFTVAAHGLSVHYRADNVDGRGNPGDAETQMLVNLASPGTHDGTIVGGSGVTRNQSRAGSPYEYGIVLKAANQTHIAADSFQIGGGTNKVTAATWEFWLLADSGPTSNTGALYGEFGANATHNRHLVRLVGINTTSRCVAFDEFPPVGGGIKSDETMFDTSAPAQIVVTKRGDQVTFYRDGAAVGGAKTNAETYAGDAVSKTLFGLRNTDGAFDGQFHIIRVYDRALGPAEVNANYRAEVAAPAAGAGPSK